MRRQTSVQATHIALEGIDDGVVTLRGGRRLALLEVQGVNFDLRGGGEQEAMIAGFAAFLNSLTFPVQLLVRVLPVDLEPAARDLEQRAQGDVPAWQQTLARDHAIFLRRLARQRTLLQRRYVVAVPADGATERLGWRSLLPFGRRTPAPMADAAVRRQLTTRCDELARQLASAGLGVRRMTDVEIVHLYHSCWRPEHAQVARLRASIDDAMALAVRASPPARRNEGGASWRS